MGRGQAACTSFAGSETPSSLLQDSERRLEVFQHIANHERERQHVQVRTTEFCWPLFLPALHHALVVSTLASVPTVTKSTSQSEYFLCDAFLNSLEYTCSETSLSATTEDQSNLASVPISLRDARYDDFIHSFPSYCYLTYIFYLKSLFILAVTKLKKEDQRAIFSRLVGLLQTLSKETELCDVHKIRMLARGVCLAAHLVRYPLP